AALSAVVGAIVKLRTHFTRSSLKSPNAFPLPEVPGEKTIFSSDVPNLDTMLVGRDAEVRNTVHTVQQHRLTFLYGESGSGKSTLLKLGLARELAQSGSWIPIYFDIWGQDWVRGPQKSLADATDFALRMLGLSTAEPVTVETVFPR
ncbi:ATP-binding protein, partial [Escherichia coli]|uniref:nSTAND1 domain-containing NTPase n=1 Tax=Escherichia coli TaxID=562 RepID=UPI0021587918